MLDLKLFIVSCHSSVERASLRKTTVTNLGVYSPQPLGHVTLTPSKQIFRPVSNYTIPCSLDRGNRSRAVTTAANVLDSQVARTGSGW